jgi:hypothetical protein
MGFAALCLGTGTGHLEATLMVLLPGLVLYWVISREYRLACKGSPQQSVPWWTRVRLLILYPAWSLIFLVFWAPSILKDAQPRVAWMVETIVFSESILLFYTKYDRIRMRGVGSSVPSSPAETEN